MIKIEVCMGTACHLRGSRLVIESLQALIKNNKLKDSVDFCGKFCLGQCNNKGVSVSVDDKEFDVIPAEVEKFFKEEILSIAK